MQQKNHLKEQELIRAAQKGDLEAFEKILFQYERAIFNYIYRLVGQRQDAEDLTQETFIKFYRTLKNIDSQKPAKSWIYKIATNTVYDHLRKKQRRPELLIIDNPENNTETFLESPAYYTEQNKRDWRNLEGLLQKIKPLYRTVLFLFYYNDLPHPEIAKILSMPLNTVKTNLRRARLSLKKEMDKSEQRTENFNKKSEAQKNERAEIKKVADN